MRPTLGNLFTFHFETNLVEGLYYAVWVIERELPCTVKERERSNYSRPLWQLGLSRWATLAFVLMTKNATGRMRRLTNWRDRLPGMCFPSLVFMAWFCDHSVIRFWSFKVSPVGSSGWLSLFSNQPALPREIFAGRRSHQWWEDNGRKPSGRGLDGEGPRALRSESIAFTVRLAVFTSLTQQSLRPGVPLAYGDIAMSRCTLGFVHTAVTSLGSTQRLKRLL